MRDNKNNSHSSVCVREWGGRKELEEKELWLIKLQIFFKNTFTPN